MGCVAYITFDNLGVNVRILHCEPDDGKWGTSADCTVEQVSAAVDKHPLVHVSWNSSGSDLAVIDLFGRISIFTIVITMNRLTITRRSLVDSEDDMNALVGLTWLKPQDRAVSCKSERKLLSV